MSTPPKWEPSADGPNAARIEFWNEVSGPTWVRLGARMDAMLAPLGLAALDRLEPAPGERAIDVGCGCGDTALELARRVGPTGSVLGVDVSAVMLERAVGRAAAAGARGLSFVEADAQTHGFAPASFDLCFSRFGVMFFADPVAAFANLRDALVPGGRLGFACWMPLEENAWMAGPLQALGRVVELPPRPEPGTPGPYAFADPEHVEGILARAGFEAIGFEAFRHPLRIGGGGTLDETVAFALDGLGAVREALRLAGESARAPAAAALRELLAAHAGSGGVELGSSAWIVTARSPR